MTQDQIFHKDELNKIKSSITKSFYESGTSAACVGFGETLLGAFGVALKVTNSQLGILLSLPNLVGALCQVTIPDIIEKTKKRKPIFVNFTFLASFTWILLLLIPFAFKTNFYTPLIIFTCLYYITNSFIVPPYSSTISSWIPEKLRGNVLGRRQRIASFALLLSTLAGGLILRFFNQDLIFYGFAIVFFLAFLFKFISYLIVKTVYEPELGIKKFKSFSFPQFVKNMLFNNFGRFTFYIFLIYFAAYTSAPYFIMYMIRDLNFSYYQYILLVVVALITNVLSTSWWGNFADRYGNMRVLKITSLLITITSLVWLFSPNFYYLVFAQILSGLVWSGFTLSSVNFIYDSTTPQHRARCVSYYNIFWNLGIFTGSVTGGVLLKMFPNFLLFGSVIPILFLISSILRFIVALIFIFILKEVRHVRPISKTQIFLTITGINSLYGTTANILGNFKYGTAKLIENEFYADKIATFLNPILHPGKKKPK